MRSPPSWMSGATLVLLLSCTPAPGSDAGAALDAASPSDAGSAPDAASPSDASPRDATSPSDAAPLPSPRVLVFTRTTGFRHASIPSGVAALQALASARGWSLEHTEDASRFSDAALEDIDVLVFLNTTGDILNAPEERALEAWVRAGGGWVGVHAAADCEYGWPFYGELVGAWFSRHPAVQSATLLVEDRTHPATMHLELSWMRRDEWYDFQRNPRVDVNVLIAIDESTYDGGEMGGDHPMTWSQEIGAGRSFYTALGHTSETYAEPAFVAMLGEAVRWAAGD